MLDKHYNWKGGIESTWHRKAWKELGRKECWICGMNNQEHKNKFKERLHMHCRTKDYSIIEEWNWKTLCKICHPEVEKIENQVLDPYDL